MASWRPGRVSARGRRNTPALPAPVSTERALRSQRAGSAVRRWLTRAANGQALVELALVAPMLLVLFAGAGDLGRAFYGYVAIENATKEGVLYGSRQPLCATASTDCPDPGNVQWRFRQELSGGVKNADGSLLTATSVCSAPDGTVRSDLHNCVAGDTYAVSTTYTFAPLTPVLGTILGGNLTVSAKATALVLNEAFDPTPGASVTKLVATTNAINAAEITSNCSQPDPTGSAGFYRSPCVDNADPNATHTLRFYAGATISYKVIVRNSGGTNLSGLTITDSTGTLGSCTLPTALNVKSIAFTCTYTRTAPSPGSATTSTLTNIATVDANEITAVTDQVAVTVEQPPANLHIVKYVSPYQLGDASDATLATTGGDEHDGITLPTDFGTATAVSITRSAQVPSPYAWYDIKITNTGAGPATNLVISDSNGSLPYGQHTATADCDAKPATLAAGATFQCKYRVVRSANGTFTNTVTVASPDDPTSPDSATATVTVSTCSTRTVPNMIGLAKTGTGSATAVWTAAGFTSTLTTWSGHTSDPVVAQKPRAFSCQSASTSGTVYR